ncbi:MAG: hypothetical protein KJ737_04410 [Proteobacteria bacterium]|nr:hypothetical protein [Pseudomonadota bacterium]
MGLNRLKVEVYGITILLTITFLSSVCGFADVKDLGVYGTSYPIIEQDGIEALDDLSKGVTIQDLISPEEVKRKIKDFRPETVSLPRCTEEREFLVGLSYSLEFDIPDQNGNIIYPKGYAFNPLKYTTNPKTYIFIDGDDPDQVNWFTHSSYADSAGVILMITKGSYLELIEDLDRPVFYALKKITDRFQLEHVPSIVKQQGEYMHVKEVICETK